MAQDGLLRLIEGGGMLLHPSGRSDRARLYLVDQYPQFLLSVGMAVQQVNQPGPPGNLLLGSRPI
jgi:hypothetical protein